MEQFIVSARKYRPATWTSVIGQSHITETLRNAITRGQLAHAYLFTGPRGVGKTTCARIFAKSINCLSPTAEGEACGVCESCSAFDQGRSFSIHELDAASNNSVDDIRALNEKVRIPPQVGRYSVYIIDEVHMLSAGAFNAFLKTLEEPPHYALFILATTEKHKILPTILSRCQCYDFNRIRVEDTVRYLEYICSCEKVSYDDESLHIIAQRADGGMRDALSMFDRVVSFCGATLTADKVADSLNVLDYNTYFEAVDLAFAQNYPELLTMFDGILRRGFDGQLFLAGLCSHIRDLLVCKNPQTAPLLEVTGAVAARYATQAAAYDVGLLFNAINLLTQADTTYRNSTNRRLHVELALIKLCGLKKKGDNDSSVEASSDDFPAIASVYALPPIAIQRVASAVVAANSAVPSGNVATSASTAASGSLVTAPSSAAVPSQNQALQTEATQIAASQSSPTPQSSDSKIETAPAVPQRRSVTGVSITQLASAKTVAVVEPVAVSQPVETVATQNATPAQAEAAIGANWEALIARWNDRGRARIATALTVHQIQGFEITITVSSSELADALNQAKWEIESDLRELTAIGGITIGVNVVEVAQGPSRPVSIEDKLQFLVNLNPTLLALRDELDLTI